MLNNLKDDKKHFKIEILYLLITCISVISFIFARTNKTVLLESFKEELITYL